MDGLPLPRRPKYRLLEVPCHSTEDYDGLEFATYPERKLGKRPIKEWLRLFANPSRELSGFLQTWLFFGLPFSLAGLSSTAPDGRRVVNMARLLPALCRWAETSLLGMGDAQGRALLSAVHLAMRLDAYLSFGGSVFAANDPRLLLEREVRLADFLVTCHFTDPRDSAVVASTGVLLDVLSVCLSVMLRRDSGGDGNKEYIDGPYRSSMAFARCGSPIWRTMRKNGWCPSMLTAMFSRFNSSGILFMSQMDGPGTGKDHQMIRVCSLASSDSTLTSKLCTPDSCALYQLDEKTYKTAHADNCAGGDGCPDIVADDREVLRILKSDSIPLIRCMDETDVRRTVDLVPWSPGSKYIAFSHVWSDGLGNVDQSALPLCQMRRLSGLAKSLPGEASGISLYWVDTIGCPPDSAKQDEAQALAINKMRRTYQEAYAVLVLDSYLLSQRRSDMNEEEILLKIVCSAWNTRLWTLQEGVLAERLFFQLADGPYDIDKGIQRLTESRDSGLEFTLKRIINQRVYEFRNPFWREKGKPEEYRIEVMKTTLANRTTSVSTDEAICLATLLDLDVERILRTPTEPEERRMEVFWSMVKRVPVTLSRHHRPRLTTRGFRWAPRTLLRLRMDSEVLEHSSLFDAAEITKSGLLFRKPGFVFGTGKTGLGPYFHVRDETLTWWRIRTRPDDFKKNVQVWSPFGMHGAQLAAFIFGTSERAAAPGPGVIIERTGILVSVTLRAEGIVHVRRLRTALCAPLSQLVDDVDLEKCDRSIPPESKFGDTHALAFARQDNLLYCTVGQQTPEEQLWCLD